MSATRTTPLRVARYALHGEIASGGMATVHYGRLAGPGGFARIVAVKRLHPQFARDPDFISMFLDEARLAARIHHPNVIATLDVLNEGDELFVVMDYVPGESLARLIRAAREREETVPLPIALSIASGLLHGLHAAHEATSEDGASLDIVHRDVSPQNVIVGTDGVARVLDFGVAKAVGRLHVTRDGTVKGKLGYMAPEQLGPGRIDRRVDIYAAGIVVWEMLTGERLFEAESEVKLIAAILAGAIDPPSARVPGLPRSVDEAVMRALSSEPSQRYATARQMAVALEEIDPGGLASPSQVADWVLDVAGDALAMRAETVEAIKSTVAEPFLLDGLDVVTTVIAKPVASKAPSARSWRMPAAFGLGVVATAVVVTMFQPTSSAPHPPTSESVAIPSGSVAPVDSVVFDDEPSPSGVATSKARTSRPPSRRVPTRKTHAVGSGCAVASYVDDAGIKHFYENCVKVP